MASCMSSRATSRNSLLSISSSKRNEILGRREVKCEKKTVVIILKSNEQGDYLNLFERKKQRSTSSVTVSEDNFENLRCIFNTYVDEVERVRVPRSRRRENFSRLRSEKFTQGQYRKYYVDVCHNEFGLFVKLSLVVGGKRKSSIAFPLDNLRNFYSELCDILDEHYIFTDETASSCSEPLSVHYEDTSIQKTSYQGFSDRGNDHYDGTSYGGHSYMGAPYSSKGWFQVSVNMETSYQGMFNSSCLTDGSHAKPYEDSLKQFRRKVKRFWRKHRHDTLPPLGSTVSWKVYCLSKGWFSHYSLLFETKDGTGSFVIELLKVEDDEPGYRMALSTRFINIRKPKPQYHKIDKSFLGDVTLSASKIYLRAHQRLKAMGEYSAMQNNCQNFVKELAKDLGIKRIVIAKDIAVSGTVLLSTLASTLAFTIIKFLL